MYASGRIRGLLRDISDVSLMLDWLPNSCAKQMACAGVFLSAWSGLSRLEAAQPASVSATFSTLPFSGFYLINR
ncbi:hypothetical protein FOXB_08808 [Fusarium oxysporum f. sp. conglutinans Fo5176]|uniref:Uncharacterized protein n=1 Tax=Fusarium oxysporum (strain Fo5176) TaxID=660025 RepID=F9FQX8_FUSOF|nr:hypothetical protein FOXB_08808 [Fusarium oxysporum f. sp. conglutinans Fo5176]